MLSGFIPTCVGVEKKIYENLAFYYDFLYFSLFGPVCVAPGMVET